MILTPRQAYFSKSETVSWRDAVGRISSEMLAPYPPGIPVLYPGEEITSDLLDIVNRLKKDGGHFHGPEDDSLERIRVCSK